MSATAARLRKGNATIYVLDGLRTLEDLTDTLVRTANASGGRDNITVIVVQIGRPS